HGVGQAASARGAVGREDEPKARVMPGAQRRRAECLQQATPEIHQIDAARRRQRDTGPACLLVRPCAALPHANLLNRDEDALEAAAAIDAARLEHTGAGLIATAAAASAAARGKCCGDCGPED